jgi:TfoX/Sxy family transcriptional regulator of competence genes
MAKVNGGTSDEKLQYFDRLVSSVKGLERKGATMPYVSHNGHMFAFIDKDGCFALRLDKDDRESFIKKFKTTLCEAHGAVLKEYVAVPDDVLADVQKLKPWFNTAYEYVKSMKPKPTVRKK